MGVREGHAVGGKKESKGGEKEWWRVKVGKLNDK